MTLDQHVEHIKQIIKKDNDLYKAKAYISNIDVEEDDKIKLNNFAQIYLKKKQENLTAWTLVGCLAISGLFIFATFFVFASQNAYNPNLEKMFDTLDVILFRAIPIGTTILALIIATTMSEKESYGMRFIRASVISGLVCYILAFIVVLIQY